MVMPPIVKLQIEDMKYQILHYLSDHHAQVSAEVERQIDAAIESYPFQEQVHTAVYDAITRAIKNYFQIDGFRFVEDAVYEMLNAKFATRSRANEQ